MCKVAGEEQLHASFLQATGAKTGYISLGLTCPCSHGNFLILEIAIQMCALPRLIAYFTIFVGLSRMYLLWSSISICLPLSIALLATEDVDDVERGIEVRSLSPSIPTDDAN
jgi:hypothetical protein